MVQSGHISVTIAICMATVVLGQLDHFLPPPPARPNYNRRQPNRRQQIRQPQTPISSGSVS